MKYFVTNAYNKKQVTQNTINPEIKFLSSNIRGQEL